VLSISIDAARAETYEVLRRPGTWAPLMKNLETIAAMRRNGEIRNLQINFVVQDANFREMLEFVELGERLGVDSVWFQRLTSYGAFDEGEFLQADVTNPAHPHHAELLEILRNPAMQKPMINLIMLLPLLPEVVASDIRLPMILKADLAGPQAR
jgi:MoaA/NifB/PqqE/SkfB family radical SAM enzyme